MDSVENERLAGGAIGGEQTVELLAGRHPNGELIIEQVLVTPQQSNSLQLLKSPVFVRGIARADVIESLVQPRGGFKVLQRGGNLCIRLFSKQGFAASEMESLQQSLTLEIEKLGGDLDVAGERVLVYSVHVSCGFAAIEKLLNEKLAPYPDLAWYYGNVYDPETGEPLDWWHAILAPE